MKKRYILTALLLLSLFLLISCIPESDGPEKDKNMLTEFYSEETRDYNLELFTIGVPQTADDPVNSRVLLVSDNHFHAFSGIGSYTDAERQDMMIELLLLEKDRADCVIFAGDMVNQNDLLKKQAENPKAYPAGTSWIADWKTAYFDRLASGGLPAFCVNASHDSMLPEEFETIFGHENNYVVLVGTTAYICVDVFSGERKTADVDPKKNTYETTVADIPASFVTQVDRLLAHGYVENAFVVCHTPISYPNFRELVAMDKVEGVLSGHSHFNESISFDGKLSLQTGHFSRGYTKMITHGLGFTEFMPIDPDKVGTVTDEEGKLHKDFSETGSPWQYRVVRYAGDGTGYSLDSFMVFPEVYYREFESDKIVFPSFTQPYVEAYPGEGGTGDIVDKSYAFIKEVKKEA